MKVYFVISEDGTIAAGAKNFDKFVEQLCNDGWVQEDTAITFTLNNKRVNTVGELMVKEDWSMEKVVKDLVSWDYGCFRDFFIGEMEVDESE